jgi:hypothetical protein
MGSGMGHPTTLYHYTSVSALSRIAAGHALTPHAREFREPCIYCYAVPNPTGHWDPADAAPKTAAEAAADTRLVRFTVRVPTADVRTFDYSPLFAAEPGLRSYAKSERVVFRPIPEAEWLSVEWRAHAKGRWCAVAIPVVWAAQPFRLSVDIDPLLAAARGAKS